MKRTELKKVINPIVKECVKESIQEVLLESGLLSSVIAEVVKGIDLPRLVEGSVKQPRVNYTRVNDPNVPLAGIVNGGGKQIPAPVNMMEPDLEADLYARRKALEESMANKMGGINIFESVTPALPEHEGASQASPMAGVDPNDAGVSIDFLTKGRNYKKHID